MAITIEAIATLLSTDPQFIEPLTGGVFTVPLVKPPGVGATPTAFGPEGQMRINAVVIDDGDVPIHPTAIDAYDGFVTVWYHAPPTTAGRAAIAAMDRRLVGDRTLAPLLHRASVATPDGRGAMAFAANRIGIMDNPEYPGSLLDSRRFQITSVR